MYLRCRINGEVFSTKQIKVIFKLQLTVTHGTKARISIGQESIYLKTSGAGKLTYLDVASIIKGNLKSRGMYVFVIIYTSLDDN